MPDDPRHYMDFTGTGNSLNVVHPSVLRLIMDSLRYWVTECTWTASASTSPARWRASSTTSTACSAFFDIIHQDPVLSQVKLIAEPWDVGPGGYQVGNFPVLWSEWNGIYRDVVRDFWRGAAPAAEFASRFTGSADLYADEGRRAFASINFITAHDGFTLRDLVSYNEKHNEANLEDNRDGTDDNRSWNCGAEGPTDDPGIVALRRRQQRNFLDDAHALARRPHAPRRRRARAHPGRQQQRLVPGQRDLLARLGPRRAATAELLAFTRRLIDLRRAHPVFRRSAFLVGPRAGGLRPARRLVVPHRRAADDPARLGLRGRRTPSASSSTARRSPTARERGDADRGRLLPAALQRPLRGRDLHAAGAPLRQRVDARALHGGPGLPAGEDALTARSDVPVAARSLKVLRRVR